MSDKDDLTQLRKTADAALKAASKAIETRGPVNWADLHLYESAKVITERDGEYFMVRIEEASPDADELQRFVAKYLSEHGWQSVRVETEW